MCPDSRPPKTLREVREKRNDFLRALVNRQSRQGSGLILPTGMSEDDSGELLAFGIQVLTWILSEEHLPQKAWNTDARVPVGTWQQYEHPEDPVGLREIG